MKHTFITVALAFALAAPPGILAANGASLTAVSLTSGVIIGVLVGLWRETVRRRRDERDTLHQVTEVIHAMTPAYHATANIAVACGASPKKMALVVAHGAETDAEQWSISPCYPQHPDAEQ